MITVHHLENSRSQRVLWLLEELGLPYEVKRYQRHPKTMLAPPELALVHPLGKSPVITDGEVTVAESGAIVEYLIERYGDGRLAPAPGTPERGTYLQWFHFGEATCLPPLSDLVQHSFLRPEAERIAAMVPDAHARATAWLAVLDRELAGRRHVASEAFSGADIMVGYAVALAKLLGLLGPAHAHVDAYMTRLEARPPFQKAFA